MYGLSPFPVFDESMNSANPDDGECAPASRIRGDWSLAFCWSLGSEVCVKWLLALYNPGDPSKNPAAFCLKLSWMVDPPRCGYIGALVTGHSSVLLEPKLLP